jgi:predicted PurR-regulated permease PerM
MSGTSTSSPDLRGGAASPRPRTSEGAVPQERVIVFRGRTALAALGVLLGVLAAVKLVMLARTGLTLIAIAAFFALALNPAVEFFQRRRLSRGWAVAAVYAVAIVVAGGVGLVLLPPLIGQVGRFVDALPGLVADLTKGRGPLGFLETKYHVVEHVRSATSGSASLLGEATSAFDAVRRVAATLLGVIVIAFLTLFMLLEGPEWRRRVIELTPVRDRCVVQRIGAGVYRCVGGFVTGNLLASLLAAAVASAIMLVTGVPYALPLGLLVVMIELAPVIGPVVATLLITVVALTQGSATAFVVFVLLVVYHVIEGHTLRPFLYGRAVALSPLTVLVAILLCTEIAGILGALLAIPVAGTLKVIVAELLRRRAAQPS